MGETARIEGVPVTTYEQVVSVEPYAGYWYEVFDGGCVTFQLAFGPGATYREAVEATAARGPGPPGDLGHAGRGRAHPLRGGHHCPD